MVQADRPNRRNRLMRLFARSRHVIPGSLIALLALSFLNFESYSGLLRRNSNSAAGDIAFYREDPETKAVIPVKLSNRNLIAKVPTSKAKGKFVITFLGDTMVANNAYNWEHAEWGNRRPLDEGFRGLKHLLQKSDFIIMNLEGAVSLNPITTDPQKRKGFNFSFGMDPRVVKILKDLGVGAVSRANNHQSDRNWAGWEETGRHLDEAGIPWFGSGVTESEIAEPLIIDTPQGRVGVSGFMDPYCCDTLYTNEATGDYIQVTLRPTKTNAKLAMDLLEKHNVDLKIAFPHWINNYKSFVSDSVIHKASDLAKLGYDLIIGSAGSHTVQPFDWINNKVPTFFDIGNFVFMKPGYWYRIDERGHKPLTYGTVTHLILENSKPTMLEIHCHQNDQDKVNYKPRVCTDKEAEELFSSLGPYLNWKKGQTFATVDLTKPGDSFLQKTPPVTTAPSKTNKPAATEPKSHQLASETKNSAGKQIGETQKTEGANEHDKGKHGTRGRTHEHTTEAKLSKPAMTEARRAAGTKK